MSAAPSVFRDCACRSPETGRQYGRGGCPKLARDSRHGSWHYVVDVPAAGGHRRQMHRSGFPTRTAAKEARTKVVQRIDQGVKVDDRETTAEYLDRWLAGKRRLKATTRRAYVDHIERVWKPLIGSVLVEQLRHEHVDAAVARIFAESAEAAEEDAELRAEAAEAGRRLPGRPRKAITPSSVHRMLGTLSSALGAGVKARRLIHNAAQYIELPRYRPPEIEPWTPAEAGAFLDAIESERLAALYELVMLEGFRRGEVCGLRWSAVDLAAGLATVEWNRVDVGGHVVEDDPKSRAGERTVALGARSVDVLTAWQLRQQMDAAEWGDLWRGTGYVFTREDGTPLRPEAVSKLFRRLVAEVGARPIRFHDLRHTNASLLLAARVDRTVVSKRLGHSTTRITDDLYTHLYESESRAASNAAAAMIPRSRVHPVSTSDVAGNEQSRSEGEPAGQAGAACRNRTDDLLITRSAPESADGGDPR
jgi:integrase